MTLIKARKIATVGRLFSPCALASYQWPVILFRRKIRPKVWAQYHPETSPTALYPPRPSALGKAPALREGWRFLTCVNSWLGRASILEPKKLGRSKHGMDVMRKHWLDYDSVALAVLLIGMGLIELLALSF